MSRQIPTYRRVPFAGVFSKTVDAFLEQVGRTDAGKVSNENREKCITPRSESCVRAALDFLYARDIEYGETVTALRDLLNLE